jgi:hypothetical protein
MGVVGPGGPGHALTLTSAADTTKVGALSATSRYYHPAGLPLRSGPFHLRLMEPVYADEAAQTGLSCSVPDLEYVPIPLPRRNPSAQSPDLDLTDLAFAVK